MDQFKTLSDYRTRVADIYANVRRSQDPLVGWTTWRESRNLLFATHPQSPLEPSDRCSSFKIPFAPYDPAFRVSAPLLESTNETISIPHSGAGATPFSPVGTISADLPTGNFTLTVYWLSGYGGGLFLPFSDTTNGTSTYGGGRYLLDTAKGADLGKDGERLVVDFNFAYHPSCVYSHKWSCPLAPATNHLPIDIPVGEQLAPE